jgi:hypothetical protein
MLYKIKQIVSINEKIEEVGKFWHELATGIFDAELIKDFEMNTKMEKNFQNVVSFTR